MCKSDDQSFLKKLYSKRDAVEISAQNCDEEFKNLISIQMSGNMVFRGLNRDDQIFSTIFRQFEKLRTKNPHKDKSLFDEFKIFENNMYQEYNRYSIQYLPYYADEIDWLASAQHFGLPTRLIDWTFDPLVALFFAINSLSKDYDGYVFTTECPEKINTVGPSGKNTLLNRLYNLAVGIESEQWGDKRLVNLQNNFKEFDLPNCQKQSLLLIKSNSANSRIIAQKGLFQIAQFRSDKFTTVKAIKNATVNELSERITRIYKIKKDDRLEVLKKLKKLSIFKPRLFPDLQNICDYIKNNVNVEGRVDE